MSEYKRSVDIWQGGYSTCRYKMRLSVLSVIVGLTNGG
jgi:hypothetical protein